MAGNDPYNLIDARNHMNSGRCDAALLCLYPKNYNLPINQETTSIVKELASRFRHDPPSFHNGDKLRVGYITEGFDSLQAPVRRMLNLSEHHDKSGLEVSFFSRLSKEDCQLYHNTFDQTVNQIKKNGCKVIIAPKFPSSFDRVLWMFDAIRQEKIDVLVTYAMHTVPYIHFLCAMKPAPILVKDCLQQPEFSTLPDVTIHHTPQTMVGDTGLCRLFPFRVPVPKAEKNYQRSGFGIPNDAMVIATVGRPYKFKQSMFREEMNRLKGIFPDVYFLHIGSELGSKGKDICTGIVDNPFDILLGVADIYLDSFPLGGGWALTDAMFAGLPVVMFDKGKEHITKESTLPEVWGISETVIPRWDFKKLEDKLEILVSSKQERERIKDKIPSRLAVIGDYANYVRERESLYAELYVSKRCTRKFLNGNGTLDIKPPIFIDNQPESIYIDNSADIKIGRGLSLSRGTTILTHEHFHDKDIPIASAGAKTYPLEIGADVQIGMNVIILPQVHKIGTGAIIGAGTVLSKDVNEYEVWAGNPGRFIRKRPECVSA